MFFVCAKCHQRFKLAHESFRKPLASALLEQTTPAFQPDSDFADHEREVLDDLQDWVDVGRNHPTSNSAPSNNSQWEESFYERTKVLNAFFAMCSDRSAAAIAVTRTSHDQPVSSEFSPFNFDAASSMFPKTVSASERPEEASKMSWIDLPLCTSCTLTCSEELDARIKEADAERQRLESVLESLQQQDADENIESINAQLDEEERLLAEEEKQLALDEQKLTDDEKALSEGWDFISLRSLIFHSPANRRETMPIIGFSSDVIVAGLAR